MPDRMGKEKSRQSGRPRRFVFFRLAHMLVSLSAEGLFLILI
jgi:hypothetical protein